MKRIQKILFVVATTTFGLLFALGTAQAQVTNSGAGQGAVDLTLTGIVQSSILLTVNSSGTTTLSTINNAATPSTATVNFGTFNTQTGFTGTANGRFSRATSGTAGAFVIAELTAAATFTGSTGALGTANINLTLGNATNMAGMFAQVQKGSPATWTSYNAANNIPAAAPEFSLCPNNSPTVGNCANGTAYAHELAVFVPDTIASGTNFSQVVHYVATLD